MNFLLVEILIWLIAASILGLVVGWLFKSLFANHKLSRAISYWDSKYTTLRESSNSEINSLRESAAAMGSENSTLQTKVGSLSAMVKSMETALVKANTENKTLNTTVSSQQLTINEIRVESENLIKKQSSMQMELNALEKSREQELKSINRAGVGKPDQSTLVSDFPSTDNDGITADQGVSHLTPVLSTPGETHSNDIDQKIRNLNEQRDRLNREREELFNQEQHFAAQLTRGDDTEAYLDQTVRIEEDLTSTIQSDTSELHRAVARPDDSLSLSGGDAAMVAAEADLVATEEKPKSLWDKFKSSVNRPESKP